LFFFFSSRRRHTRSDRDWSSDVCSSDLSTSLEALSEAGWVGVGHTELLARFAGVPEKSIAMMLASNRLRVVHVSTHVSLRRAIRSEERRVGKEWRAGWGDDQYKKKK